MWRLELEAQFATAVETWLKSLTETPENERGARVRKLTRMWLESRLDCYFKG